MDNLFVVVDEEEDRAVLVQAKTKDEAIDAYFKWADVDEEEIDDEDREDLDVSPVVPQQFSDGIMEVADW